MEAVFRDDTPKAVQHRAESPRDSSPLLRLAHMARVHCAHPWHSRPQPMTPDAQLLGVALASSETPSQAATVEYAALITVTWHRSS